MIRYALVGLSDPRHHVLTAPFNRRRAGIRPVAVAEGHATDVRDRIATDTKVPGFAAHEALLTSTLPDLVGVAVPSGAHPVITAALDAGAGVLVLPPLADTVADLDDLAARIAAGAAVTAVHTWRGHQTATLAAELLARGRLGQLEGVALTIGAEVSGQEREAATYEAVDLFCRLTGAETGTVRVPIDEPARDGEVLRLQAGAEVDGRSVRLEIWQTTGPAVDPDQPVAAPYAVEVIGSTGTVEWDVRSGRLVSVLGDAEPVVLSCGRPSREADWVLTNLVRAVTRPLTGPGALVSTRVVLQAKESEAAGGTLRTW
ncbi:Gfo/Idh/MocA family oxidoreductase [Microlunatus sp. Y2014]|uniref:Gfo/Idh/MocA family oxidoreductase n=1 Tax=Microlunatus sp. Y2014 TaxID=3418488 RepID=UPI003DA71829